MSKVDWSLAPEGATHYAAYCYYKKVYGVWMMHIGYGEWCKSESMYNGQIKPSEIIERPKQPEAWSGPQDGLPPVGAYVELATDLCMINLARDTVEKPPIGTKVFVSGVANFENSIAPCVSINFGHVAGFAAAGEVRPIRTPEQLADESRETAIREFMDVVGSDCRVIATKAVDAGFKLEVV